MAKGLLSFLKPAPNEDLEWFLDDKTILKRYMGQSAFLHSRIYQKLVEILGIVFDGYLESTYTFLPVDDDLEDYFQRLRFQFIDLEKEMRITNLRIVDFQGFYRLNGNFQHLIGMWQYSKMMYFQDQERLLSYAKKGSLPNDMQLMFIKIDGWLKEHQKNKAKLLGGELNPNLISFTGIQLDLTQSTLKYLDSPWLNIQMNQREMLFLRMLLNAKGRVIEYLTIARSLNLNVMYQGADKEEIVRTTQFLKRNLGNRLKEAGMKPEMAKQLLQSIESIHGIGYKLLHLS